jgi:branched-chain amino acid transport system permease protein
MVGLRSLDLKSLRRSIDFYIVVICFGFLVVSPLIYNNFFYINALYTASVLMLAGMAWVIMGGYTGLISFGHAAFFGLGAYTLALTHNWGVLPWLGLVLGGCVAALFAAAVSYPLLRLKGRWFSLATLAMAEALKLYFNNWNFVGGSRGIELFRREYGLEWIYFASPIYYNYVAYAVLIASLIVLSMIVKSRFGYYTQAIRESEETAMAVGVNTFRYKQLAMVVSGFFTGIAGALYTIRFRFIDPFAVMDFAQSLQIIIISVAGGIFTLVGPIMGALIITPIAEYVRAVLGGTYGARFFGIHMLIYGVILLALVLYSPGGLHNVILKLKEGRKRE